MENPWGEEPDWARRNNNDENDDDGDDDDLYTDSFTLGAQHVLVLIDCNPTMFLPTAPYPSSFSMYPSSSEGKDDEEEDNREYMTPIDIALQACEKLFRLRVNYAATSKSGRSRDGVGVLLYGCQHNSHREDEDDDSETDNEEEDQIPTLFSNTRETSLSSTYELVPLSPPGTEQVLNIMDCYCSPSSSDNRGVVKSHPGYSQSNSGRRRNLHDEFTSSSSNYMLCTLRSALHEASKIFANAKCVKKNATSSSKSINLYDSKTIWIFTNNDNPCHSPMYNTTTQKEEERQQLLTIAKDAMENGIDMKIWPLPCCYYCDNDTGIKQGNNPKDVVLSPFDWNLFYDEFNKVVNNSDDHYHDDDESMKRASSRTSNFDLDEMMESIKIHWKKVRKAFSLPLLLPGGRNSNREGNSNKKEGEETGIMLDFFRVVNVRRRPQPVTVHQGTNKMTVKTTQTIALETGEIVTPDRIQTYVEFGGEHIPLSRDEVSMVKQGSNTNDKYASISLIGFQHLCSLPPIHMTMDDKYYIVYPNEDSVNGSKKAFDSLYASMVRKEVFAVGELLTRVTGMCRLVAILPEIEGEENEDAPPSQPGFLVFQLPYEDDVRAVDEENNDDSGNFVADETTIDAAVKLIQKQRMDGIEFGYSFENPALKNFWNYIQSVALGLPLSNNDDSAEEDCDQTIMNVEDIIRCASKEIEGLKTCLPEEEIGVKTREPAKRKISVVEDDSGIDWVHAYETNTLSDYTSYELKKYLRSVGEKISGRKADLVERVEGCVRDDIKRNEREQLKSLGSSRYKPDVKDEGEV